MGAIVNPGNKPWYTDASGITVIGTTKTYNTYMDMLREPYPGKLAWVLDASGDPTVNRGSALYAWRSVSKSWEKLYEQEMMDSGDHSSFLGWIATPEQLEAMYPIGQAGWYAVVGSTDTIWVWDTDTSSWKNAVGSDQQIMWEQIVNKPTSCPISFVTGLQDALDGKVGIANLEVELEKYQLRDEAFSGSWNDLTDKPTFLEGLDERIGTIEGAVDTNTTAITNLQNKVDNLSDTDIAGMDQYFKKTDSLAWSQISNAPEFITLEQGDLRYALAAHTHDQYATNDHVAATYYNKEEVDGRFTALSGVYAPLSHTHTMDDIVGYVEPIPTHIQVIRPVEEKPLFLKVEIFGDNELTNVIKTIDSRVADDRDKMSAYNGTAVVPYPENGLSSLSAGKFVIVNIGQLENEGLVFIKWSWSDAVASEIISSVFAYPALTPSDMLSVGNYWRNLN